MQTFSSILVPYDTSASSTVALEMALQWHKRYGSRVTAVYVSGARGKDALTKVKSELAKYEKKEGMSIRLMNPKGSRLFKEVVRTSEDIDADLIIMGNHTTSGVGEFWVGSNAYRVVSSSKVPVITMQGSINSKGFNRILAPIDQSKETRQKVPMVSQIAKNFGAEVVVLGASKHKDTESRLKVANYLRHSQELLMKFGVKSDSKTILGANVAKTTLNVAEEIGADLIVMMDESEPSKGLFMGTNARQVISKSTIPVLTLHAIDVGVSTSGY